MNNESGQSDQEVKNSTNEAFVYRRRVAFHETDAMGVVHHSNHVKLFEEARVEWLRDRGLIGVHYPYGSLCFAVVEMQIRYLKPARFDEELSIRVEAKREGARIMIRYAAYGSPTADVLLAEGLTALVPVNAELRPVRLPRAVQEKLLSEIWSEVWPRRSVRE